MLRFDKVILVTLTEIDAHEFFELYKDKKVNGGEEPFLPGEQPIEFTRRIISLCQAIFSIRLAESPEVLIGDCALHHWNQAKKEIEIGGSLYPEYWGKGYMQSAFTLLEKIAKEAYKVDKIIGKTKPDNRKAIKLVEKLGFKNVDERKTEVIMCKEIT